MLTIVLQDTAFFGYCLIREASSLGSSVPGVLQDSDPVGRANAAVIPAGARPLLIVDYVTLTARSYFVFLLCLTLSSYYSVATSRSIRPSGECPWDGRGTTGGEML